LPSPRSAPKPLARLSAPLVSRFVLSVSGETPSPELPDRPRFAAGGGFPALPGSRQVSWIWEYLRESPGSPSDFEPLHLPVGSNTATTLAPGLWGCFILMCCFFDEWMMGKPKFCQTWSAHSIFSGRPQAALRNEWRHFAPKNTGRGPPCQTVGSSIAAFGFSSPVFAE
jgi:hypothetical protein